jgi:hypothetical protein
MPSNIIVTDLGVSHAKPKMFADFAIEWFSICFQIK